MKRTLTAIAAMAAVFAGTASAQNVLVGDTETLNYNLTGFVQSECTMTPNGNVNRNIVMDAVNAQGVGAVEFSCNSPYTLSVKSANGGMQHQQSSLLIPYQLRTGSLLENQGTLVIDSADLAQGDGEEVETSTDWLSIIANRGKRQINLDVGFTDDTFRVAGNYSDTLTVTLKAL